MALGCAPNDVEELSVEDYELMYRYWIEEPWGAFRDNIHAALVAMEVRQSYVPKWKRSIEPFLVKGPSRKFAEEVEGKKGVFGMLKTMAKRVKRPKGPKK